jgi:hypothetical protein
MKRTSQLANAIFSATTLGWYYLEQGRSSRDMYFIPVKLCKLHYPNYALNPQEIFFSGLHSKLQPS